MHSHLLVTQSVRGKYETHGFNTKRAAEQAMAEARLRPEIDDVLIVDVD